MNIKKYIFRCLINITGSVLLLSTTVPAYADTSTNINYSGTLIALPCTIEPGMENLHVTMNEVPTKSLYRFRRTAPKLLSFTLKDCDPTLAKNIIFKISPIGPNSDPEGLLDFSPTSEAQGAGMAFETFDGKPILLDTEYTYEQEIESGNMTLNMNAFLQGKSDAIANRTIVPGSYSAVMVYTLQYE